MAEPDDQAAARARLAAMLGSPDRFENPASLRLQLLAPTLPPNTPESTRAAFAAGTLPPIINPPEEPESNQPPRPRPALWQQFMNVMRQ